MPNARSSGCGSQPDRQGLINHADCPLFIAGNNDDSSARIIAWNFGDLDGSVCISLILINLRSSGDYPHALCSRYGRTETKINKLYGYYF